MNVRDRYWKMLVHLRYGLDYYHEHLFYSVIFDRYFKMFIAIFTATSVISWEVGDTFSGVWAILVGLGQIAVLINEFLPYKTRISQLQGLKAVLNKQFQQAENKWRDVNTKQFSDDEINDRITECLQHWADTEDKFIKDDCLPEPKWLTKRAQRRMIRYFQFYYGGEKNEN